MLTPPSGNSGFSMLVNGSGGEALGIMLLWVKTSLQSGQPKTHRAIALLPRCSLRELDSLYRVRGRLTSTVNRVSHPSFPISTSDCSASSHISFCPCCMLWFGQGRRNDSPTFAASRRNSRRNTNRTHIPHDNETSNDERGTTLVASKTYAYCQIAFVNR
jgi:hypothetical protein